MGRYDNHYTGGLTPGRRGVEARSHVEISTRVHIGESCSGPSGVHVDRWPGRIDRCPGSEKGVPVHYKPSVLTPSSLGVIILQ